MGIFFENDEPDGRERPNKSQLKRESQMLLDLAKALAELQEGKWAELSLPDDVLDGLFALQAMHQYGARKRQLKLIGKLLRGVDVSLAEKMMAQTEQKSAEANAAFHQLERWRDQLLLEDGAALTDFIRKYPHVDVQQLRRLVRSAQAEVSQNKTPKSSRLLFKFLKNTLE